MMCDVCIIWCLRLIMSEVEWNWIFPLRHSYPIYSRRGRRHGDEEFRPQRGCDVPMFHPKKKNCVSTFLITLIDVINWVNKNFVCTVCVCVSFFLVFLPYFFLIVLAAMSTVWVEFTCGCKHTLFSVRCLPLSVRLPCMYTSWGVTWNLIKFHSSLSLSSTDVNSKLGMPRPQIGPSISQQGFFSSRDSLTVPCVSQPLQSYSAATSDMDLSRKNESKSTSKLKASEQPLLSPWNPSTAPRESIAHPTTASTSVNHLGSNNGSGVANNNNADRWATRTA